MKLISHNFELNRDLVGECRVRVAEVDFFGDRWRQQLRGDLEEVEVVFAADVVYHSEITDVRT